MEVIFVLEANLASGWRVGCAFIELLERAISVMGEAQRP